MVATTPEFWEVDGVSLQTFAFNISTLGGDRLAPPPLRGSNIAIPYMPGRKFVPKIVDSRVITLGMWVIGTDENGNAPADRNAHQKFMENWRMLVKLLWNPRKEFVLTKRIKLAGEEGYRTVRTNGQYAGGLTPSMAGPARGVFTVDIQLSDPFFAGDAVDIELTTAAPSREVLIVGDDRTTKIEIILPGAGKALRVTNNQEANLWMQYNRVMTSTQKTQILVDNFRVNHDYLGASVRSSGSISRGSYSSPHWMFLDPGYATLTLSEQGAPPTLGITGSAIVRYTPNFL